ncbi:hypothetical protein BS78_05G016200 [Paspalum vaginatum]|nr:hypothetical protein BS78_05G016200 [Paspalum vaginatum]
MGSHSLVVAPGPGDQRPPHAVCLPCPAQGHVTPMMKLAKLLHRRVFHITFVNTEFNHRRLLRSRGPGALDGVPGFRFAAIPDGLPPSDADATQDVPSLLYSTSTTCLQPLLALLADLNNNAPGEPPVTCLVVNGVMSFGYDAAREIGVPVAALWTASACGFGSSSTGASCPSRTTPSALADDADAGGHLATVVQGARGMCDGVQLRDFPSFIRNKDRADVMLNILMREAELDAMSAILPPLYTVGPLLLRERVAVPAGSPLAGLGSNLWKEQAGVLAMDWLGGVSFNLYTCTN